MEHLPFLIIIGDIYIMYDLYVKWLMAADMRKHERCGQAKLLDQKDPCVNKYEPEHYVVHCYRTSCGHMFVPFATT
jgi:hypothetical protein